MDTPNARICIHHRQQRHAPAAAQIGGSARGYRPGFA
jgi:hypothetical protein